MSIHSSLKVDPAAAQQRSVLSRIERLKDLMKKGLWKEGQSVTGLPKTRIIKLKTKKAAKATAAEGAVTPSAEAAPAAAPAAGSTPALKAPKTK